MGVNRQYKDSVFSWLFSDPVVLRELYGALEGVELPPDVPIQVNTLEGVLYKGLMNDISFEVGGKIIILIEHQSTINPNMAVRLFLYTARVYEKITGERNLYSGKLIKIPRPELFVFYNGTEPYPDEKVLKLSDSFEEAGGLGNPRVESGIELMVKVYNINPGHNEGIVKKSETLRGYCVFIDKVREYEKESVDIKEAMKKAVEYCIEHDILKKFLKANAAEVCNMLLTEWDWDKAFEVQREEGREEGREETAKNALAEGLPVELIQKITGLDSETIRHLGLGIGE